MKERIEMSEKKKIYLAGPYSHKEKEIRNKRFEDLNKISGILILMGYHVFSPISHSHPIAESVELPTEFDFWCEYDTCFINWSDGIFVYCNDGWKISKGVTKEIEIGKSLDKPIYYIYPENVDFERKNLLAFVSPPLK